jgi:hypothetical protein
VHCASNPPNLHYVADAALLAEEHTDLTVDAPRP